MKEKSIPPLPSLEKIVNRIHDEYAATAQRHRDMKDLTLREQYQENRWQVTWKVARDSPDPMELE